MTTTTTPIFNKLKPASRSYLHRDNHAVIGIVCALIGILLTAQLWLVRLLG
jgi:hypothetical protein